MSSSPTVSPSVEEFIRGEVKDWDDEVKAIARFKSFSGQRSDWEPKYYFWRDLILKVARHLGIFLVRSSEVKNIWFTRGGLNPLCLDQVMLEMYNTGEILLSKDLVDPSSGQLSRIFRRVTYLVGLVRSSAQGDIFEDYLIFSTLLKDKADEIVKVLSEEHWTSSCIITMSKFHDICGGSKEASAVLSHLSGREKAKYLVINKGEFIEGVKVSLSPAPVSGTSLDCNLLHLIWTAERLQKELDVINERNAMSRKLALASLKSGNKKFALMHARKMKIASESREKCSTFLDRVEEVLRHISDAESSKMVSETLQMGVKIIKENQVNLEEVQLCLEELDESIDTHKQVANVLESSFSSSVEGMEDEDIEDEFKKLELEVRGGNSQDSVQKIAPNGSESAELLADSMSNLKLTTDDGAATTTTDYRSPVKKSSLKDMKLEEAV